MTSPDYITHEEIRQRAHELWERAGRPDGKHEEHWLTAERELQQQREHVRPEDIPSDN
jgi:hypothetical protein